jgi:hypothetical protein
VPDGKNGRPNNAFKGRRAKRARLDNDVGPKAMRISIAALALLLTACVRVPALDESEAMAVTQAASELLKNSRAQETIPPESWPAAIENLKPESVRAHPEGLYIETSSMYVEEWGLFVPREPATFAPVHGSDPEYKKMHPSLFSYYVAG